MESDGLVLLQFYCKYKSATSAEYSTTTHTRTKLIENSENHKMQLITVY